MIRIRTAFLLLAAFSASPSLALEPIDIDPMIPVNLCELNPALCIEILPIDPCILNPALCIEILPIDPCILNPALCIEILPIDPCVLFPETCVAPPSIDPDYAFGGRQKVKVAGAGKQISVAMYAIELGGLGFAGMDEADRYYVGTWVPVGKTGHKFALTLDPASKSELAAKIAAAASSMTGAPQNVVFTKSPKIILKIDDAGGATLKIKCRGVLNGTDIPVKYKAKLVGQAVAAILLP